MGKISRRPWKRKDLVILKRMLKAGHTRAEVAKELGRTQESVTQAKYGAGIGGRFPRVSKANPTPQTTNEVKGKTNPNPKNKPTARTSGTVNLKIDSPESLVNFIKAARKEGINVNLEYEG